MNYETIVHNQRIALAQKKKLAMQLRAAFNPLKPNSRPTPDQDQIFRDQATDMTTQVVQGGNQSGKSQSACKTVAHFMKGDHPYLDMSGKWGDEPILILFLSRNSEQYTEHWEKRIRPFLAPGSYHESKQGSTLKNVRMKKSGNKIIFFSYENPRDATDRVQSFDAHLVIIDELCSYLPLFEECDRRVQIKGGLIIYAFTAKRPAPRVRKFIKSPDPWKKQYTLNAFDNPCYDDRDKAKIMAKINSLPLEERQRAIATSLEGGWYDDEEYVYGSYDSDVFLIDIPSGYSMKWRHAEIVDAAGAGKVGYILAAEDPRDPRGIWYIVKAKYLPGEAPTTLLDNIRAESYGHNITHRIGDGHEAGFIKEAKKQGQFYKCPRKKDRKYELITGVSEALKAKWLYLMAGEVEPLEDELETARWDDNDPTKIYKSTRYHLLDCLQYFVDLKPKWEEQKENMDVLCLLDLANRKRKKNEANKAKAKKLKLRRFKGRQRLWRKRA